VGEPESAKPPVLTCEVPFKVRLPMLVTSAAYWKRRPTVRATFIVMPPAPLTLTFCGPLVVGQKLTALTTKEPDELLKTRTPLVWS
jgi:hypothetical protein